MINDGQVIDVTNYDFEIMVLMLDSDEIIICKTPTNVINEINSPEIDKITVFDPMVPIINRTTEGISLQGMVPFPFLRRQSTSATDCDVSVTIFKRNIKTICSEVDQQIKNIYLNQLSNLTIPQNSTDMPDIKM